MRCRLALAWAMVLMAGGTATGQDEGLELYNKGDYVGALLKWRDDADEGNARAMHNIGLLYDRGLGVKQDYAKAMRWYRKAADEGVATAMKSVGDLHRDGHGVRQDYVEAMRWYDRAADEGDGNAMNSIGVFYNDGNGVKQDYIEAMRWYRRAADEGVARGMANIGLLYDLGRGVKQDYIEALRWYRRAADKGDPIGMNNLGFLYMKGQGVKQDALAAVRWYTAAASKGHTMSMLNVGVVYYDGQALPRALEKALSYFEKATDQLQKQPRGPLHDYTIMRIWLCLNALDRKKDAKARVAAYRSKRKPEGWPGSILAFMDGELEERRLLAIARLAKREQRSRQQCEAYFYIGSAKLFAGERGAAISFFKKSVDTGESEYSEYESAKAELKRLRER